MANSTACLISTPNEAAPPVNGAPTPMRIPFNCASVDVASTRQSPAEMMARERMRFMIPPVRTSHWLHGGDRLEQERWLGRDSRPVMRSCQRPKSVREEGHDGRETLEVPP